MPDPVRQRRIQWVTGVMQDVGYPDRTEIGPPDSGLFLFDDASNPDTVPIPWDSNAPGGVLGVFISRAGISPQDWNRAIEANMPVAPYISAADF